MSPGIGVSSSAPSEDESSHHRHRPTRAAGGDAAREGRSSGRTGAERFLLEAPRSQGGTLEIPNTGAAPRGPGFAPPIIAADFSGVSAP